MSIDSAIAVKIVEAINKLREGYGSSVTIACDNEDGPPNNAVECNAEWTGWQDERFHGETLLEALELAVARIDVVNAKKSYERFRDFPEQF